MRTPGPPTTSSSSSTPGPTILSLPPSSGIWTLTLDAGDTLDDADDAVPQMIITDADVQDS